jgi:hypothetical protein
MYFTRSSLCGYKPRILARVSNFDCSENSNEEASEEKQRSTINDDHLHRVRHNWFDMIRG